jgi:hypothetical protein
MSDRPEWFAPRRYGFGSGRPISWQGWVVTIAYVAAMSVVAFLFHERPYQLIAALIPLAAMFMVISAKTTRGGWRWRWGGED